MSSGAALTAAHLERAAYVYIRQSSDVQVKNNVERQRLQYAWSDHAKELGFHDIEVIDEDLGISGAGVHRRRSFPSAGRATPSPRGVATRELPCLVAPLLPCGMCPSSNLRPTPRPSVANAAAAMEELAADAAAIRATGSHALPAALADWRRPRRATETPARRSEISAPFREPVAVNPQVSPGHPTRSPSPEVPTPTCRR